MCNTLDSGLVVKHQVDMKPNKLCQQICHHYQQCQGTDHAQHSHPLCLAKTLIQRSILKLIVTKVRLIACVVQQAKY